MEQDRLYSNGITNDIQPKHTDLQGEREDSYIFEFISPVHRTDFITSVYIEMTDRLGLLTGLAYVYLLLNLTNS